MEKDYEYNVNQCEYISNITELPRVATIEKFRTTRHKLAWISITRPNICALAKMMSEITENLCDQKYVTLINKAIKTLPKTKTRGLRIHTLDPTSL